MKEKVTNYIYDNKLINTGDKILVALSGGPDSVCLLNLLIEMKGEFNIEVGAAHINHMLRGDEAYADEEYVKRVCELNDIPCFIKRVDINRVSKEKGISSEMAGREERYNFFDEIRTKYLYDKVALAHNANDQAETVLMRLMRGSGLEGLTGIKAKRDEIYIRPILGCDRSEIESYCMEKGLKPRIDKTNLENIYSRNKVRLELIPYIRENFNTDIINTLNRIARLLEKDSEFIQCYVDEAIEKCCVFNEKLIIRSELFELKEAILTRAIKNSIMRFSQKYYNIEMKHIHDIVYLQNNKSGSKISLPNELEALNSYGNIEIKFTNHDEKENIKENNILITKENVYNYLVEFYNYNIEFNVLKRDEKLNFSKDPLIKYFDYDKIVNDIEVRRRKAGDTIKPYGMKGKKKLKDLFMDLKIPREDRDEIPLVCFNNEIAWIVGIRTSEDFKINKNTKNILSIKFSRKE